MGTRQAKSKKLKEAELKLKAARRADQLAMRNPDNPLKSAKANDQSNANKINAAVAADVKKQEGQDAADAAEKDLPVINTTEELEPIVEELKSEIQTEEDAKVEENRLKEEMEEEIERRAEKRFQEKMATRQRQEVVTAPSVGDPTSHKDCCLKLVKAIEGINRLKSGITSLSEKDVKNWLQMLTAVKKRAATFSTLLPKIDVPEGKASFAGFDLVCGDNDRENRIYINEFIGYCEWLIEASVHIPSDWSGQKWVGYTKQILKALK
jgi:hypothetical protein